MTRVPTAPLDVLVVADGDSTAGAYVVLDVRVGAGTVLPPHRHGGQDAVLLVLEGELAVACAEDRRTAGVGDHVVLPRASPCRLEARTDARILVLAVPAGLEALVPVAAPGAPADPDDLAALLTVAGVRLLPAGWGTAA